MEKIVYLLFFLLPFLQACNEHKHYAEGTAVELDNGKPWKANPESTAGIANMQSIIVDFESGTIDADSWITLRKRLENEFQEIFRQCTMEGESHNQLHNYLLPMKGLFEKLESKNQQEAKDAIAELKQHLSTYQTYFE